MWCLTAPGVVVHRIRDDKSAATFKDLVGDYSGTIVCDDQSVRILDELKEWLSSMITLTSLSIGKAAAYTLGNWPKLIRFVDDARIPLDNNATERGIRGPVVGRRNHFGSKSRRGTEVAATLYTLVETTKLHDIDPAADLHAAIVAADRNETLLPWTFAAGLAAEISPG